MEIPRYWRERKKRLKDFGLGKIYAFNTNLQTGEHIAIIEFEGGGRITAGLTEFDSKPKIGQEVKCVTRKWSDGENEQGLIVYGYKFRPLFSSDAK